MSPQKNKKIWLSAPDMGGKEEDFVRKAFEENFIAPVGNNIKGFEHDLEVFLGNDRHAVALNSGTSALHLALVMAGVKRGDDVLCQSFTFSATANSAVHIGATPVFVDSETDTWNMNPDLLEKAIKDRMKKGKKAKAVIVVDLYGMPCLHNRIRRICSKYNISIIEDAAEALGSRYKNKPCGTLGDFSAISFNGNKIITTSSGGALITSNKKSKERAIFLATQAKDNAPHYQHSEIGYNFRMSNILAGIGRGQMQVLDAHIKARRSHFEYYRQQLSEIKEISLLQEPKDGFSNRWLTCILTPSYDQREQVRKRLQRVYIDARPLWKPLHLQPVFKDAPNYLNGVSHDLFERGLCLPSGSNLQTAELDKVISEIKSGL